MKHIFNSIKTRMVVAIIIILSLCALPFLSRETKAAGVIASGVCGDNLTWVLDSEGTLNISGSGPMTDFAYSEVRWNGYESSIKQVVIEDGVTHIGDQAFRNCINLRSITFPDRLTSIGLSAFLDCSNLTNVTLPTGMTSMEAWAFSGCTNLTSITIPEGVTSIENNAFQDCSGLTSIKLPSTLTEIVAGLFVNCTSLEHIFFSEGLLNIGRGSFYGCSSLKNVVIPNGVTSIEELAFYNCMLDFAVIPESVTSVEGAIFAYDYSGEGGEEKDTIIYGFLGSMAETYAEENGLPFVVAALAEYTEVEETLARVTDINRNLYTADSLQILDEAVDAVVEGKMNYEQEEVDAMAQAIEDALATLIEKPADYTAVNEAKACASALDRRLYTEDSLKAVDDAAAAVIEGKPISEQEEVDAMAQAIRDAIAALIKIPPADYTAVNEAKARAAALNRSLYTADSLGAVDFAVASVVEGKLITEQEEVDAMAQAIEVSLAALIEKPANYTAVNEAKARASALNRGLYTEDSLKAVDDAVAAVIEGKPISEQEEVDAMARAIEDAIKGLIDRIDIIAFGTCGEKLTWTLDDEGTLTIRGSGEMASYQNNVYAPWHSYISDINKVEMEEGVTNIGAYAFQDCSNMKTISIPYGVKNVGMRAFYGCSSLEEVLLPDGLEWIGTSAFGYCSSLTEFNIPDGVTSIGSSAFYDCSSLPSIELPESLTRLESQMFYGCSSLESIIIPDGVTEIPGSSFYMCSALKSVDLPESVQTFGQYAFAYCRNLDNIVLPDGVTSIGKSAFLDCKLLENISIPDSVSNIGEGAFGDCYRLTSIRIPGSVSIIGAATFQGCTNLTDVTIAEGVTTIGNGAFSSCRNLSEIVIPASVTSIESYAFYKCSSLTSITILGDLTDIGKEAFYMCSALTNIDFQGDVTSIGESAFYYCSMLTDFTIPDGLTSIGENAFQGCSIKRLYINDLANYLTLSYGNNVSHPLYSRSNIDLYINDELATNVIIPEGVTNIPAYSFHGCSFSTVTIPGSVAYIGSFAFYSCDSLVNVTLSDGLTTIDSYAFSYCTNLSSIIIPDSVTYIGAKAFSVDLKLQNVELPYGLTAIYSGTFESCSRLTGIYIPDSVTSIGSSAFKGCSDLTSIVIPDGVTTIGDSAFYNCRSLSSIVFPTSVKTTSASCFGNISSQYKVYTIRGSKANSIFDPSHVFYLVDFADQKYLGFRTDRIVISPGGTASLSDYLVTNLSLSDLSASVSNTDLFFYDNGTVAALGEGQGTLTISGGDFSATVSLIATSDAVDSTDIKLKENKISIGSGKRKQIELTISPDNATDNMIIWSSSDPSVVSVNNGLITAQKTGTATITAALASNEEVKDICEVTVSVPLRAIVTFEAGVPYTLQTGKTQKLQYYLYPNDADDVDLTFASNMPHVVSIDADGMMTAHSNGTAIITISSGGVSRRTPVTAYTPLKSLSLDQTSVIAACGDTIQLKPIFEPENTSEKKITWSSNKESVATVDDKGKVTVHGQGIAIITASAGNCSVTCNIVCNQHTWDDKFTIDKEPSYTEEGSESIHCKGCGAIDETTVRVIPKLQPSNGWVTISGERYYYENNVLMKDWLKYEGSWYYLNPITGAMQTGLKEIKGSYYYLDPINGDMKTGWINDNGNWYYAGSAGALATGWLKDGNAWYYLNPDTCIMATGWVKDGGTWYYMNPSGAMATGWVKDGNNWYYMNSSGAMVTGWVKVGNTWYYMKSSGAMADSEWVTGYYWISGSGAWTYQPVGSWKKDGTGWWFGDTSGWYAKNETLKINDNWYTFNAAGYWVE